MYAPQQSPLYMVKPCVSSVDGLPTSFSAKTIELLAGMSSDQCTIIGSGDSVFVVDGRIDSVVTAENHGNVLSKSLNKHYHHDKSPTTDDSDTPSPQPLST